MGPFTLFASPMLVSLVATIEKPQFEGRTRIIARHVFSISLTFSCRQLLVGAPPHHRAAVCHLRRSNLPPRPLHLLPVLPSPSSATPRVNPSTGAPFQPAPARPPPRAAVHGRSWPSASPGAEPNRCSCSPARAKPPSVEPSRPDRFSTARS